MYNMKTTKAIKQNYFQRLHCRHLARGLQTKTSKQVIIRMALEEHVTWINLQLRMQKVCVLPPRKEGGYLASLRNWGWATWVGWGQSHNSRHALLEQGSFRVCGLKEAVGRVQTCWGWIPEVVVRISGYTRGKTRNVLGGSSTCPDSSYPTQNQE